ncbi:RNA polymerase sigma factor [Youxingia wuxianensis]|uniref:Sigma-70 family RNA polymerase sigma factor n=1 Tax=Youxingia wuxianensis TaxID=2763678 RepID=A0A926ESI2_9FIRM|nr:sigma-70 family RNA polymerase sigma factor [Youxingia wuxianensis]MBC8585817.1 sigma-70 family RNA polymerase sigma factor [Youxingia wuxianensis]
MDADKKRVWVSGQYIEVTGAVYDAYMKGDRKIRYFENDLKTERVLMDTDGHIKQIIPSREDSLDRLMDDNAEQFTDHHEIVEDMVLRKISAEKLYQALAELSEKERELIVALFFEEKTERELAAVLGISQPAVHKQKNKILKKLKTFLEK